MPKKISVSGKSSVMAFRLPIELSEAVKFAARASEQSVSDFLRLAFCKAWAVTPEPRELRPQ